MKNLNEGQLRAIGSDHQRILVLASPGSGKTTALTHRVENLIRSRFVSPQEILCLTFTNKAARDMRERINEAANSFHGKHVNVGTFHQFGLQVIEQFGAELGYTSKPTIFDPNDQAELFKQIKKDLGIKLSMYAMRQVLAGHFHRGHTHPHDQQLFKKAYYRELHRHGGVDFDSIIVQACTLMGKPNIKHFFRERYPHVLIDEFQDTSPPEWKLITALDPRHLFCVGDLDQAIYEWRDADLKIIRQFAEESTVIRMEESFRCPAPVARAANLLISHNEDRIEKAIVTKKEGTLTVWPFPDSHAQNKHVVSYVEGKVLAKKRALGDFFVLARTNRELETLALVFEDSEVPFKLGSGAEHIWSSTVARWIHHTLELIVHPTCDFSAEMCAFAKLSHSPETVSMLKSQASASGKPLIDWMLTADEREWLDRQRPRHDVVDVLIDLEKQFSLTPRLPEEAREYFWKAMELIHDWRSLQPSGSVETFLRWHGLRQMQDSLDLQGGAVVGMTVHGAKGLEAPEVIVLGMNASVFPNTRGKIEEERRLAYVAWTRAIEDLTLCTYGSASPFLVEADAIAEMLP